MAIALKFAYGYETVTGDMSLLDGDTGAQLDVGWTPRIARPACGSIPPYVTEQIPIRITFSSQDGLATEIQELHHVQQLATEYRVLRGVTIPVWLHSQLGAETGARRAFVRRIDGEFLDSWYGPQPINAKPKLPLLLEVERHPYWESPAIASMTDVTPAAAVSVTYDYTSGGADVVGDVPARLVRFSATPSSGELGRLWIGSRSGSKYSTLANFVNHWECENVGGKLGTDAARATDATAHPGGAGDTKVTVTPGTTTWAKRLTLPLSAITPHEQQNFGIFLWLLRCQVSAGTWEVQLRWGYSGMNDADRLRGPIIEVNETSWDIKEMGIARVPLRDTTAIRLADMFDANIELSYEVQIWARRTDGTGTLDLDCICPVPVEESWMVVKGIGATSGNDMFHYGVSPDDRVWGGTYDAGTQSWQQIPAISVDQTCLGLPIGDGRLIIVYARDTTSVITDRIALKGEYHNRWLSLRGAE